jgi:hypothetical protein
MPALYLHDPRPSKHNPYPTPPAPSPRRDPWRTSDGRQLVCPICEDIACTDPDTCQRDYDDNRVLLEALRDTEITP